MQPATKNSSSLSLCLCLYVAYRLLFPSVPQGSFHQLHVDCSRHAPLPKARWGPKRPSRSYRCLPAWEMDRLRWPIQQKQRAGCKCPNQEGLQSHHKASKAAHHLGPLSFRQVSQWHGSMSAGALPQGSAQKEEQYSAPSHEAPSWVGEIHGVLKRFKTCKCTNKQTNKHNYIKYKQTNGKTSTHPAVRDDWKFDSLHLLQLRSPEKKHNCLGKK